MKNINNHGFFITIPAITIALFTTSTMATSALAKDKQCACTNTSRVTLDACRNNTAGDFWTAVGKCYNLVGRQTREQCKAEAQSEKREDKQVCGDQFEARLNVCERLGEKPYDPRINPTNFVDPTQIGGTVLPNLYFPLIAGTTRTYDSNDGQTITVSVTGLTKVILGVTCRVVHDVVEEDGQVIEDTEDWFAQDVQGNVWYFGEISQDLEDGELVSLNGSWKAGVDGAKAGIIMKASPHAGDVYRQEFALGEAEDMAQVLSLTDSATVPAASCNGNCLVTEDFTPLEPGVVENKYYAPGIGAILEVNPETGTRVELVEIDD